MIGKGRHRLVRLDLLGAIVGALDLSKNAPNVLENIRNIIKSDGYGKRVDDKAWSQFCGDIGRGPDAPCPGMIEAFEDHYGQSFTDKDWRNEAGTWAAAWGYATRQGILQGGFHTGSDCDANTNSTP